MIIFKTIILLCFFLVLSSLALAATYTVGSGGQYSTIQACANVAQAGDTCLVNSGTYDERVVSKRAGTSSSMITFKANGNAVVRGFELSHGYIKVEGFEITNYQTSHTGRGIILSGQGYLIVNNHIHHTTAEGVFCNGGCSNSIIRGNYLEWIHSQGITIEGDSVIVENNEIYKSVQRFALNEPTPNDADGMRFFGSNHIIRNNYIHDIVNDEYAPSAHADCFQTHKGRSDTHDITITGNVCINVDHQCIMASQAPQNANRIIFTHNVCDINGGQAAFLVDFSNSVVNNNVFYKNIRYRAVYLRNSFNVEVKNNIFSGHGGATIQLDGASLSVADYNLLHNINGNHIQGPHDVYGDPLFVNPSAGDFHVQSGSPACGAGEGGTDIGAFPCGATTTTTTTIGTTTTTIIFGISPDTNGDGCVDLNEIIAYIQLWKNGQVTLNELISAIDWWKQGC